MEDQICIRHVHESKRMTTWCGRSAPAELACYQGADHALYSLLAGEGKVCGNCLMAVHAAFENELPEG